MKPQGELEQLPSKHKNLYGITNWTLFLAGTANLVVGTLAAFNESTPVAATSLTAGLVMLFAATIDRFEFLKGLGIEAKTKQLDKKIDQADHALQRLREMTEITGTALIDMSCRIGRMTGPPSPREFIDVASNVSQIMKNLGSEEKVIADALKPWAKILCFDMARIQTHVLHQKLMARSKELISERDNISQPISPTNSNINILSERINSVTEAESRISNLYNLKLEDFPEKFIEIFQNVPEIDVSEIELLFDEAKKFIPGMKSLKEYQTLTNDKLWLETLEEARRKRII